MCVFFFKQKTAYDMRISDWSSDVCCSDLAWELVDLREQVDQGAVGLHRDHVADGLVARAWVINRPRRLPVRSAVGGSREPCRATVAGRGEQTIPYRIHEARIGGVGGHRSEEHTSELQSLMRISYAVFCLQKQKH